MSGSWVCVDASFVVRMLVKPEATNRFLVEEWLATGATMAAPTLLFYEVTNALYQYQRHGWLDAGAVELAQSAALALPVSLFGGPEQHRRALRLTAEMGLGAAYDAHYLAVAEDLDAELWTADERLERASKEHSIRVRVPKEA